MARNLYKCSLFSGMDNTNIDRIYRHYGFQSTSYPAGEVFAIKGARYSSLLILVSGIVRAETTDRQENTVKIERITPPSVIMPVLLYAADNTLPVNLMAKTPTTIVSVTKEKFTALLTDEKAVLENFLSIVSSPNRFASDNIVYLTFKTIKGKFANYLLDLASRNGSNDFHNPLTQEQMAELFGVTRPALARAIGELAAEGTIYVRGKRVEILFTEKLRQYARN
ncbi:MAG: Crp/Fnr family transcriptional regulator [Rikenellaceae bacterium]|nr:Crp/Fnr family transcriptional regulator [Rikenellaceae bacterium]